MYPNRQIGINIRRYRRERKLTQKQLSSVLFVSYQAISAWERGQSFPDLPNAIRLARFFGITLDQLVAPESE